MHKMEELRDMLCHELENMVAEGEITTGSLDIIDKLTHSIKSIDTIMAMEDYDNEGSYGYSRRYDGSYRDGSYDDYSRRGSYARGRRNARRDSMGRYSRRYSRAEEKMSDRIEDMMQETDDPVVRQALQKALSQMED